ncbi:MAG: hypothetical protein AW09_000694 [Candidatus Accumulibacter phosphatis]|uniref:Uncharacterized protein n=1 Tax=Candidatus Accumulibacter phosphatis TaxID=327160 RepID=A0A080LYM7_9PROT|nr:MAG: hypothetical protein AW09_000694 [Candidatus Accumulibacter phosphatis]
MSVPSVTLASDSVRPLGTVIALEPTTFVLLIVPPVAVTGAWTSHSPETVIVPPLNCTGILVSRLRTLMLPELIDRTAPGSASTITSSFAVGSRPSSQLAGLFQSPPERFTHSIVAGTISK